MGNTDIIAKINWYKPTLCMFHALMIRSTLDLVRLNITAFVRVLLFIPFDLPLSSKKLILISYFRSDLLKDFDAIIKVLSKEHATVIIKNYRTIKFQRIYISDVVFAFHESSKIIARLAEPPKNVTLARGVILFFILEGIKIVRHLSGKDINFDSVLSLMEMQFSENIICQYFRLMGAKTFAYQHGYYHDDGSQVTTKTYIPVNYLASVCDTALAWGEKNKTILERYTDASVVCVGKPYLLGETFSRSQNVNLDLSLGPRHLVVILDNLTMREKNIQILRSLSIANRDDGMLSFIAHPDDPYDYAEFNANRFSHGLLNRDQHYIVANNSSAILQYGRVGFNILLFSESKFCEFISKEMVDSLPVLRKADLFFYEMDSTDCKDIWSDFIYDYGDGCLKLIAETVKEN